LLKLLKTEQGRLDSFLLWDHISITPESLAKAGLFYFNENDAVQCAFCLGILAQWETTDIPLEEHKKYFPRCPFILGLPVGNIRIESRNWWTCIKNKTYDAIMPQNMPISASQLNRPFRSPFVRLTTVRPHGEPERGWFTRARLISRPGTDEPPAYEAPPLYDEISMARGSQPPKYEHIIAESSTSGPEDIPPERYERTQTLHRASNLTAQYGNRQVVIDYATRQ
jgi:hypothetical protein